MRKSLCKQAIYSHPFTCWQPFIRRATSPDGSVAGYRPLPLCFRAKKASSPWCKGRSLEFRGTTLIPAAAGS
ncbi:MAG: hypothetical protein RHS_2269 [Robinsoniella sp. RHS]|nr:MAG: hypothetical protein RHS_2269 [Robinsoniella sp. RHS]